ncbi:MAG: hypothetical protein JWQ90_3072 [Hydrocarboniphaga sp.]|uniref:DUF2834 domain-containing protein n=1 Tax=Hydrocarboniphaga sp. TaxID=2033016 RepID=UPI0026289C03|nr:DUF2834 domain-containing protein [Hydrocarboniphaga sp.]MDB5970622.1 hypothetical protein [Hydrocarboniphaga sp.]
MNAAQRAKFIVYLLIAAAAAVGTWAQNLAYLPMGMPGMLRQLVADMLLTPGTRSISIDAFMLAAAIVLWMIGEGRRLKMRSTWWYVLGGMTITISIFVPLFLAHRERLRARLGDTQPQEALSAPEWVGFALLASLSLALLLVSFMRL